MLPDKSPSYPPAVAGDVFDEAAALLRARYRVSEESAKSIVLRCRRCSFGLILDKNPAGRVELAGALPALVDHQTAVHRGFVERGRL